MDGLFAIQESGWMSSDGNESHSGASTKATDDDSNSDAHLTDNDSQSDIGSDEIADENSENNEENRDLPSEEYRIPELDLISFIYSMNTDEDYYGGISPFDPFDSYPPDVLSTTDQDTYGVSNGSISDSPFTSEDEDNSGDEKKRRSKAKCKRCKPRDSVEKDDSETDDDDEPISYIGSTNSDDEALNKLNEDGDHTIVKNKVSSSDQDSDEGFKDECQGVNESDEDGYENLKNRDTSLIKYHAIQHVSW